MLWCMLCDPLMDLHMEWLHLHHCGRSSIGSFRHGRRRRSWLWSCCKKATLGNERPALRACPSVYQLCLGGWKFNPISTNISRLSHSFKIEDNEQQSKSNKTSSGMSTQMLTKESKRTTGNKLLTVKKTLSTFPWSASQYRTVLVVLYCAAHWFFCLGFIINLCTSYHRSGFDCHCPPPLSPSELSR